MTSSESTYPPPGGFPATSFFSKTYDETLDLLAEALDYARIAPEVTHELKALSLMFSQESMRLTARLTQIMAWLVFQRAVHAGEITPQEAAAPSNRLGGHDICYDNRGEDMEIVPDRLRDLLLRSRKLYQRIARLDDMIARDVKSDTG